MFVGMGRWKAVALALAWMLLLAGHPGHCSREESRAAGTEAVDPRGIDPRIAGGKVASPGQFPFMALLYDSFPVEGVFSHYCGGSLILPWIVLTAAHCTLDGGIPRKPAYVRVGLTDAMNTSAPTRTVVKMVTHPDYNEADFSNDVALLQLSRKVNFRNAYPVPMARYASSQNIPKGANLTVIGFGRTEKQVLSKKLLYTNVEYVPFDECKQEYAEDFVLTNTTLCAGTASDSMRDACVGDSGGPMMGPDGNQIGIVSFGDDFCGGLGHNSGYTDVGNMRPWINKEIRKILQSIPSPRAVKEMWLDHMGV